MLFQFFFKNQYFHCEVFIVEVVLITLGSKVQEKSYDEAKKPVCVLQHAVEVKLP